MSKSKKIISVVLAALLVTGLVTGVAIATANYVEPAPLTGLFIDGKKVEDPGYILKIGDEEVSFDDYRHYYLLNKTYMEQMYGAAFWKEDYDGAKEMELKKTTDQAIHEQYAWLHIAKENNITLTEEEKAEIVSTLEEQKKTLGDEFPQRLRDMFFTDEAMYLRITEMQALAKKAQTQYEDLAWKKNEATLLDSTVVTAKHILFAFPSEEDLAANPIPGSEDQTPEEMTLEFALEVEKQIREQGEFGQPVVVMPTAETADDTTQAQSQPTDNVSSTPAITGTTDEVEVVSESKEPVQPVTISALEAAFNEMRAQYDSDSAGQPEGGYTFGPGQMVEEFYDAALALEVGQMSEPIKTDYGYHIIFRMPLDTAAVEENKDSLLGAQISEMVKTTLDAAKETLPLTKGDHYAAITPTSLR